MKNELEGTLAKLIDIVGEEKAAGILGEIISENADSMAKQFLKIVNNDALLSFNDRIGITLQCWIEDDVKEETANQDELNERGRRKEESEGVI